MNGKVCVPANCIDVFYTWHNLSLTLFAPIPVGLFNKNGFYKFTKFGKCFYSVFFSRYTDLAKKKEEERIEHNHDKKVHSLLYCSCNFFLYFFFAKLYLRKNDDAEEFIIFLKSKTWKNGTQKKL